ncbi:hypothetical protein HGA34_04130 [Candidatus Falkowbacteria bacterium]|nr:hypothetical protein [Candidatus Falkowbacteria bacterium]
MAKFTAERKIERRVMEFNELPPERRIRRLKLLRELLRMDAVKIVVIYGRACYYPSRKKLEAEPSRHVNARPRYLEVFTSTGKTKIGFVSINEPAEDGTLEHERIQLADIALGCDQLLEGIEKDHFLLKVTVTPKE